MTNLSFDSGYNDEEITLMFVFVLSAKLLTFNPLSSSVRSSTDAEITSHLQSMSERYPLKAGEEADSASCVVLTKR